MPTILDLFELYALAYFLESGHLWEYKVIIQSSDPWAAKFLHLSKITLW